jgi:nucleotidyltransferase substrate binding protein (TIGR01987 family)
MVLELLPLRNACAALSSAIAVLARKLSEQDVASDEIEAVRAGVVQNFECTYELCWKMLRRQLTETLGRSYVSGIARIELFRRAHEEDLIDDVERWMLFHRLRNEVAHTYDEQRAVNVAAVAVDLLAAARALLAALER